MKPSWQHFSDQSSFWQRQGATEAGSAAVREYRGSAKGVALAAGGTAHDQAYCQVSSFLEASYAETGTTAFGTTFSLANTKNSGMVSEEESDRPSGAKKNGTKGENKVLDYEITGASTIGALVDYASYINMASPRGSAGWNGYFHAKEIRVIVQ